MRYLPAICIVFAVSMWCFTGTASARTFHILAFGDSITQGKKRDENGVISGIIYPPEGARTTDGYEPDLEDAFDLHTNHHAYVYNWGYAGERTYQGVNRIDSVLDSRKADFILLMEGANDIHGGVSTATTRANLQIMIEKSRAHNIAPIIATITPNTANEKGYIIPTEYNPAIRSLAAEQGISLADQYEAVIDNWFEYHSGDGLHLNDEGEQMMAQEWLEALQDHGLPFSLAPIYPLLLGE